MTNDEKNAKIAEFQKGLKAGSELQKGFNGLDPQMFPFYLQGLQLLISIVRDLLGLGEKKDVEMVVALGQLLTAQSEMAEAIEAQTEALTAIKLHLENTCLSEIQVKQLFENIQNKLISDIPEFTARKIPGELMKMHQVWERKQD